MAKRNTSGGAAAGNGNGNPRVALAIKTNDKGQVFSHVRQKWLVETPEERVRQAYVVTLHNEYGFDLDQLAEECRVGHGRDSAKADFVIWRSARDKTDERSPMIVVECKSDNVTTCLELYQRFAAAPEEFILDPCSSGGRA
jgi:type I restriction enzyme M protein